MRGNKRRPKDVKGQDNICKKRYNKQNGVWYGNSYITYKMNNIKRSTKE
jgi:hypothetical protein